MPSSMNSVYLVGLTGGISEGKTTCLSIFKQLGASTMDADRIAHVVYRKGSPVQEKIVSEFGHSVLGPNGIDRRALGRLVFQNEMLMKRLTDIVWPEMFKIIKQEIIQTCVPFDPKQKPTLFVLEAAVLCEAKWDAWMDHVVVVRVDDHEIIKERLLLRDPDLSLPELESRLRFSLEKRRMVDEAQKISPERFTFIDSATSQEEFKCRVEKCYEKLLRMAYGKQESDFIA